MHATSLLCFFSSLPHMTQNLWEGQLGWARKKEGEGITFICLLRCLKKLKTEPLDFHFSGL